MRYFQYDGEIPSIEVLRKKGMKLSAAMNRNRRRAGLLGALGTVVFWVLFLVLGGAQIFLINWIMPGEEGIVWVIVDFVGKGILYGFAFILAAIAAAVAASPLWGKRQNTEKALLREALSVACTELKAFYQFQKPFLGTKCYRSSDRRFDRHDVCMFVVGDELRITANLHYGFFDPKRDLGCYCLSRREITLSDTQHKDRSAVELQADGVSFLLATQAAAYIKKMFLKQT